MPHGVGGEETISVLHKGDFIVGMCLSPIKSLILYWWAFRSCQTKSSVDEMKLAPTSSITIVNSLINKINI